MYEEITQQTKIVVTELLEQAKLRTGSLFVVGCSSSEMVGKRIGKGSSMDAAQAAIECAPGTFACTLGEQGALAPIG